MDLKQDKVKSYFDQTGKYLKDNYNIRFRREIVQDMLKNKKFNSILDIACGSAEISIPFLNENNHLLLLDISKQMLDIAEENVPAQFENNVQFVQQDILDVELPSNAYDLIICMGLLAHVDDPNEAINKIIHLAAPGGIIILQNTNSKHFYSKLNIVYRFLGMLFYRDKYLYNQVSDRMILSLFKAKGFKLISRFNYIQSFMFIERFITSERKYNLIKRIFGSHKCNLHSSWGNDCIYFFSNIR